MSAEQESMPDWRDAVISVPQFEASHYYSYWHNDELRIRAFLISSIHAMSRWFEQEWKRANAEADAVFDPDIHDPSLGYDNFLDYVGIDTVEYMWQLSSAVIKDACGLLEIYLEQAANEVLRRWHASLTTMTTEDSWGWVDCQLFYKEYLRIEVRPPVIDNIVWMRNKMAHLRSDLRSTEGRAEFQRRLNELNLGYKRSELEERLGLDEYRSIYTDGVHLSLLETYRILDLIRDHVNGVATEMFQFTHGDRSTLHLEALIGGTPIRVRGFNERKLIHLNSGRQNN